MELLEILDLSETDFSDGDLGKLPTTDLVVLNLNDTRVSDAGLVSLTGRGPDLSRLVDGLVEQKAFRNKSHLEAQALEDLSLNKTGVTNAGLDALAQLPSLTKLSVQSDRITDNGLEIISWFPRLEELDIRFSKGRITENGIAALAKSRTLTKLSLSDVDDNIAAGLAKLHGLRYLVLDDEHLDKSGMLELAKLHGLVQMSFSPFSKNRKYEFQKFLPQCTINPDKKFLYSETTQQIPMK